MYFILLYKSLSVVMTVCNVFHPQITHENNVNIQDAVMTVGSFFPEVS